MVDKMDVLFLFHKLVCWNRSILLTIVDSELTGSPIVIPNFHSLLFRHGNIVGIGFPCPTLECRGNGVA
jgi:hypothetical protein